MKICIFGAGAIGGSARRQARAQAGADCRPDRARRRICGDPATAWR